MELLSSLLVDLPPATVNDVRVGAFWTAVVLTVNGEKRCGLASTLRSDEHHRGGGPAVPQAGHLLELSARELAQMATGNRPPATSIGIAALNALVQQPSTEWIDLNAEDVIARYGAEKNVALVGHFPFIPRLRERVGQLWVLEQHPGGDDLPATAAETIIPQADVVAITGTTFINHTAESLLALCQPTAQVLMLGPSTPLSPKLFQFGINLISGSVVENIPAVLNAISQGANFRQIHRAGVRLVTMVAPSLR